MGSADHDSTVDALAASLQVHRDRIDAIDKELVQLLNERATCAQAIGKAKMGQAKLGQSGAIFVPHREQQVFDRISQANQGPLPDACLRAIWREVMSGSFALEKPLTISHFGQAGAFTHQAARLKFGESVDYDAVETIAGVFTAIERGQADYGVVPIENSTDGGITDTIDSFLATPLRIVNELTLRIRHFLMATGPLDQLQRIYSKHTAFGQCRTWLANHCSGVELVEVGSTTQGAERAAADPHGAAIGNREAAIHFNLDIIADDIEDNPNNTTRFVVLALPERAAQPTGNDKTSLMLGMNDEPGALYQALTPLHQSGLSLSRIESRPSRRKPWEYLFFVDVIGHELDPGVSEALQQLGAYCSVVQVLGSYPCAIAPLNA